MIFNIGDKIILKDWRYQGIILVNPLNGSDGEVIDYDHVNNMCEIKWTSGSKTWVYPGNIELDIQELRDNKLTLLLND